MYGQGKFVASRDFYIEKNHISMAKIGLCQIEGIILFDEDVRMNFTVYISYKLL